MLLQPPDVEPRVAQRHFSLNRDTGQSKSREKPRELNGWGLDRRETKGGQDLSLGGSKQGESQERVAFWMDFTGKMYNLGKNRAASA